MSFETKTKTVSIIFCLFSCIVIGSAILGIKPASGEDEGTVLQGQIEKIDEDLSAIPQDLLPGHLFDPGAEQIDNSTWYRIPHWFAGQWTADGEQAVIRTNLITGKSKEGKRRLESPKFVYFGCVQDANGDLWERAPLNRWRLTQYEGQNPMYALFTTAEVNQPDQQHLVIKSVGLNLVVDRLTKKIRSASQEECLHVYSTKSDSLMTLKTTGRSYDATGKAYEERVATSEMAKVRDIDLDSLKLKYLRDAFRQYAEAHEMSKGAPTP